MSKNNLVAVIDCPQQIPCNPCETACPFGAITVGADISGQPVLAEEKCRGCGLCVAACPGIAIRLLGPGPKPGLATVVIPHEYLPLPALGAQVNLADENGRPLGQGEVVKLWQPLRGDPTWLLHIVAEQAIARQTRGLLRTAPAPQGQEVAPQAIEDDAVLVCRCEEVSRGDIKKAIAQGARSLDAIKRRTRCGMGLCQGNTCGRIAAGILAGELGLPVQEIPPAGKRPPVGAIGVGELANGQG